MKYIKYLYSCAKVAWSERHYRDVRAKRRRMAREFERLARRYGV
jgi:hypothetical protein